MRAISIVAGCRNEVHAQSGGPLMPVAIRDLFPFAKVVVWPDAGPRRT